MRAHPSWRISPNSSSYGSRPVNRADDLHSPSSCYQPSDQLLPKSSQYPPRMCIQHHKYSWTNIGTYSRLCDYWYASWECNQWCPWQQKRDRATIRKSERHGFCCGDIRCHNWSRWNAGLYVAVERWQGHSRCCNICQVILLINSCVQKSRQCTYRSPFWRSTIPPGSKNWCRAHWTAKTPLTSLFLNLAMFCIIAALRRLQVDFYKWIELVPNKRNNRWCLPLRVASLQP
jgi:hypothetical protein